MTLTETWDRLERHLAARCGGRQGQLRGPVKPAHLVQAESATGLKWPVDLCESLTRHDGEEGEGGVIRGWRLMPTSDIVAEWEVLARLLRDGDFDAASASPGSGVQRAWWDPAWLPVSENGGGDHHCVDLRPGAGGKIGQVLVFWHDAPERVVVAPSLGELLTGVADEIDTGRLVVDPRGRIRRTRSGT